MSKVYDALVPDEQFDGISRWIRAEAVKSALDAIHARLDALEGKSGPVEVDHGEATIATLRAVNRINGDRIATLEARLARLEAVATNEEISAFRDAYEFASGGVVDSYRTALTAFLAGRKGA